MRAHGCQAVGGAREAPLRAEARVRKAVQLSSASRAKTPCAPPGWHTSALYIAAGKPPFTRKSYYAMFDGHSRHNTTRGGSPIRAVERLHVLLRCLRAAGRVGDCAGAQLTPSSSHAAATLRRIHGSRGRERGHYLASITRAAFDHELHPAPTSASPHVSMVPVAARCHLVSVARLLARFRAIVVSGPRRSR